MPKFEKGNKAASIENRKSVSIRKKVSSWLQENNDERLNALLQNLYEKATQDGDVPATKLLLEYGFGKPAQMTDSAQNNTIRVQFVEDEAPTETKPDDDED